MIGSAGAAIFFLQRKGAKTELGAFFQDFPRNAVFPVRFLVELQCDGLDLVLGELPRQIPIRALLVVETDIEHDFLPFRCLGR